MSVKNGDAVCRRLLLAATAEVRITKYIDKVHPLSKSEYEALKESIRQAGKLYVDIAINEKGDVLDGHHRIRICDELV